MVSTCCSMQCVPGGRMCGSCQPEYIALKCNQHRLLSEQNCFTHELQQKLLGHHGQCVNRVMFR